MTMVTSRAKVCRTLCIALCTAATSVPYTWPALYHQLSNLVCTAYRWLGCCICSHRVRRYWLWCAQSGMEHVMAR